MAPVSGIKAILFVTLPWVVLAECETADCPNLDHGAVGVASQSLLSVKHNTMSIVRELSETSPPESVSWDDSETSETSPPGIRLGLPTNDSMSDIFHNETWGDVIDDLAGNTSPPEVLALTQDAALPTKFQYMRAKNSQLYLHSNWGTKNGHTNTLHSCPKVNNHPNCFFTLEPSYDGQHYYIKASDAALYVHAHGGNAFGNKFTLHQCPKPNDHPNCQFAFEPSPTTPGHYYIRAKGSNLYLHAHGGNYFGATITLHTCPKQNDHPNCQWQLEPQCADVSSSAQCDFWKSQGWCGYYKEYCRKTCQYCVTGVATGEWSLVNSNSGGSLKYTIGVSASSTTGETVTASVGVEVTTTVSAGVEFGVSKALSVSGSTEVSTTVSASLSQSLEQSFTKLTSQTTEAACDAKFGETAWIYRWVMKAGKYTVETEHFRCHITSGVEKAPECPFMYCGSNNPFCEASKCPPAWQA